MALTQVDQGLLGPQAQYTGFKNRIINGGVPVWQRGTSFTISTTTVTYTADRFGIYQPSGTGTVAQSTDVPSGFKYSMLVTGAGTDVIQRIEANNTQDLSGATVTVSFWMKQTVGAGAGSMTVQIQNPTVADNWTGVTNISSSTITPTSSWAQYSVTFTGLPSGVLNGLAVNIFPTSTVSSSTFYITGVQLEKGSTATSFDYRPYGTELALCQRYFEKSWDISTAVGTGEEVTADWGMSCTDTSLFLTGNKFKVTKRSTPTMLFYNTVTGASGSFVAGSTTMTVSSYSGGTSSCARVYTTAGYGTVGVYARWHWTASSEL